MRESTRKLILAELEKARVIAAKANGEDRDLTTEERGQVMAFTEKANELKKQSDEAAAALKSLGDLGGGIEIAPDDDGDKAAPSQYHRVTRGKSVGQAFVDSAEYKAMLKSVPDGRFGEQTRVQSAPFGVKSLLTGVDDSGAGPLLSPQSLGLIPAEDPFLSRPLTIRSLFTAGTTTTDTVDYVRILGQTNNAAPVAEATSAGKIGDGTGGTVTAVAGGLKPESGFTTEKQTTNVKTIASWMPATKRALSDAAQVRTLIDSFLRTGLEEEFEDQLIGGDGSGENFLGLNNTSGVQTQAAPAGGEDNFTVTRRARRKVKIGGRAIPTAYAMNPIDWENIELARNVDGNFYGGGPFATTPNTLWGLPVVESEAVPVKTAWCAAWRMGVIWDREQASVQASDNVNDYFIRNLVAILAEMRAAFGILRPAAFCKITLA